MKIITIAKFINHSGVDVSYPSIYQIIKGREMSFETAYKISNVFTEKDILSWKKTKGDDFVSFFSQIIPDSFLDKVCGVAWERKKIIDRYGSGIAGDFEKVRKVPMATLQDVADRHGFTREYARQLYLKYFGEPYTKAAAKKAKKVKDVACRNDPRHKAAEYKRGSKHYFGAAAEKLFMCRCELAGLDVVLLKDQAIDMMVNGNLVDVKASKKTNNKKYHFSATAKQTAECDFFACYADGEDCFYIIPNKKEKKIKRAGFYIPVGDRENKYSKYKNRFDLLTTTKEDAK